MMSDTRTYSIMAKPVGSRCNLVCEYCYYLDKPADSLMDDALLDQYTKQVIAVHGLDAEIEFAWHGGEPTLAGTTFFERALAYQKQYGKGRVIRNTLQTNATLLDDDICRMFKANDFLLGVSIDGPEDLHNRYRGNTFNKVMRGIELLKKYDVPFNTLTAVHAGNYSEPERVYRFLCEQTDNMQFLPVVELLPALYEEESGQRFATPPGIYSKRINHPVAESSLPPEGFGSFMCGVFEIWKREDLGRKFVQLFENTTSAYLGHPATFCTHDAICGHCACVLENGDVYCCDRYCYKSYRMGNLLTEPLITLLEKNREFGLYKTYGLPDECYDCDYVKLCFGGCPKDRVRTANGKGGNQNYLCEGYKLFFGTFSDWLKKYHTDVLAVGGGGGN